MLLIDETAICSESYPEAVRLLAEVAPDQNIVAHFRALSCERMPSTAVEITRISLDVELAELKQRDSEPLSAYYKRVTNLMQRVGVKDRSDNAAPLIMLESAMLDTVLRAFVRGIKDQELRTEATRGMAPTVRSPKLIF